MFMFRFEGSGACTERKLAVHTIAALVVGGQNEPCATIAREAAHRVDARLVAATIGGSTLVEICGVVKEKMNGKR